MREKIRGLGIKIGTLPVGNKNSITDIPNVKVGHATVSQNLGVQEVYQTGVTAILPHQGSIFENKVPAASFVLNGYGKTTGLVQIDELGYIESPIMLTNTFSVGNVWQGTLEYMMEETPEIGDTTSSANIVVGECNDSYLNSVKKSVITAWHVKQAINNAREDFLEGSVGAGTGMMCFGYKGGIGSSSRLIGDENPWTVGVLVVSNFGKRNEFQAANYMVPTYDESEVPDGSIMIVVGTDAPVTDRQLKRLAKRATIGLARTGSMVHNGSGDIIIAFSNANQINHWDANKKLETQEWIRDDHPLMNQLFQGVAESTEEAILNSLTTAETTNGRKNRVGEAIPYHLFKRK